MKLKICGMKYEDNMTAISELQPDYLGFIFYKKSSRFFDTSIPEIPKSIKRTGVFVNASIEDIFKKIKLHDLQAIQLHGSESVEFCAELKKICHIERSRDARDEILNQVQHDDFNTHVAHIEIIKVFSIKDEFDFTVLKPYEAAVDYFLFDTKGKLPGGNGVTFDWKVLENYPSKKPFFLSGGIGLETIPKLEAFLNSSASNYCHALDINSKFEIVPGLKDVEKLKEFKNKITTSC
ncbi:phosphoribosylanthranilate isomerase [Kordia sp. YSTF-M3]|uniref:N-(5'-phosphoribosyl)anthranilate isomerase n=1 Tax=Kordia aestuariivivens TaxID=2759037 RepID=A0ABR7Q546_9FLAO|nr:phosphoribosylanthranilate isomerase [Kordia aestuariivivens]MBC8753628.1 phosphoribosylanthranilate isomerase [Kordia aestuariivivens]